ncbi:ribonuclease PH [Alkalihalobacillus xiaoxiensis]|uniref:Ribonuclease PH n=1 Tax=Shouchella xiaoxiensis TaxID=766895 RepID=A0ABS2SVP0_9BACI|nr:ribonuclease PH [Shouchella xiaoxiensis]MBM7838539.1 ribonuclease PH [Shouchella xiaoxiensis]
MRKDGRAKHELRHIEIVPHFTKHAEGSVLITVGETKVICTASIENKVPPFLRGQKKGWLTAEYSMLPRATEQRTIREATKGKVTGRTMEIQRLIGRALRAVIDLEKLGERTIWIDCDVIQADGGTRAAAITGAYTAMVLALTKEKSYVEWPITDYLAAVSVGLHPDGGPICDLDYKEDSDVDVDMNVVQTGNGRYVEIQGSGEEAVFSRTEMNDLLDLAENGIRELIHYQKAHLGEANGWIERSYG